MSTRINPMDEMLLGGREAKPKTELLTPEEVQLRIMRALESIQGMVKFFVVITVLSIILQACTALSHI